MQRLVSVPSSTFFGSLFVILTTMGLIGNIIVIIAISTDRKMRKSVMNMLLLNLVNLIIFLEKKCLYTYFFVGGC